MNRTGGQEKAGAAKHLVMVSYDAFSQDNWEMASGLPHMSALIKNGAYTTKLKSVYPTLTYVVHTTMITGVYPDRHGVIHNNPLQPFIPEKEQHWFWYRSDVKTPTLYDAVKKHNMTAAGILWPVTGKASIRYNLPEIAAINRENQAIKVLRNGSPLFCLGMELKYGRVRKGTAQPYLDDFTTLCAIDAIKRKKPNLLLMHLIELDDAKHHYGTDSIQVERAVHRMDARLGRLVQALDQAGIAEDTVIMIVGDHGQLDVKYKSPP
jgi:predicted AlkP superfamily pyrophosphatase or phosphodiesterase